MNPMNQTNVWRSFFLLLNLVIDTKEEYNLSLKAAVDFVFQT